ncbi:MAG: hypothetical protein M1819_005240 [Sarea resinae]|nr:MAG: hypothetical protein M1819_005240 [Sarea resinae]
MDDATVKDSFLDLERHRLRLEDNVAKLRKSLQHWQTWEAEYEGLKEEIIAFRGEPSSEDLAALGADFGGTLVNAKEFRELLGEDKGVPRSAEQIVGLLSRRLDYVQQNVRTVEKQLNTAEDRLNAVLVVRQPDIRNEEGLPLMEIREELDEDGNVISGNTLAAGSVAPQVIEALRKAGVTDFDKAEAQGNAAITNGEKSSTADEEKPVNKSKSSAEQGSPKHAPSTIEAVTPTSRPPTLRKKSVTFSPDTKSGDETPWSHAKHGDVVKGPQSKRQAINSSQWTRVRKDLDDRINEDIRDFSSTVEETVFDNSDEEDANPKVTQVEDINDQQSPPIVPLNESPEDAVLRREMLQYGLSEVGAVVAELDLDENGSQYSDDEEEWDSHDEDDEDEDRFGRSVRSPLTAEYRAEMEALERKLNARMMENVGPKPEILSLEEKAEQVHQVRIQRQDDQAISLQESSKPKKKGVRFAQELNVSSEEQSKASRAEAVAPSSASAESTTESSAPPIQDSIVERKAPTTGTLGTFSTPRKQSRFKSARSASEPHSQPKSEAGAKNQTENRRPVVANGPLAQAVLERRTPRLKDTSLPLFPASTKAPSTFPLENIFPTAPSLSSQDTPEGPQDKILSDRITEHAPSAPMASTASNGSIPEPPDAESASLDPALHAQEIAVAYHKMRNNFVHQSGGFTSAPPDLDIEGHEVGQGDGVGEAGEVRVSLDHGMDDDPTTEGSEGGGLRKERKMSRFRAARLGK